MKKKINQKFEVGKCYKNTLATLKLQEYIKVVYLNRSDPHGIIIRNSLYMNHVEIGTYIWHSPENFKEISEAEFEAAKMEVIKRLENETVKYTEAT